MTDSIPSDHAAVDSHRVELESVGRTSRPQLPLPAAVDCAVGDVVELTVFGDRLYAEVVSNLSGESTIEGAFANRRLARANEGENLLRTALDDRGFGPGTTLVFDVVTEGHAYGLREPGSRVVYEAADPPNSSLTDIARSLEE
ncbi:MAG: DUF7112 family protein [Halovenus sp.]